MNFRVPKSTFKISLYNRQDYLAVILTKLDARKEEWGDYEVQFTVEGQEQEA